MSYFIALSGMSASQRDLDTSSNNIANVNTVGFKGSRAEFSDVYASSLFTNSKTKVGDGVKVDNVAQQFKQGSVDFTENSLDMMIEGSGFFITAPEPGSQDYSYTRAGAFKLSRDNYITDNSGSYLQAYPVNAETGRNSSTALSTTGPVEIPSTAGAPRATNNLYQSVNLDSRQEPIVDNSVAPPITYDPGVVSSFNPEDPTTYTDSTSLNVYDSLGEAHTVTTYYVRRDSDPSEWDVYQAVDGQMVDFASADGNEGALSADIGGETYSSVRIAFDASGRPMGPLTAAGSFPPGSMTFTPSTGAEAVNLAFNFSSPGGSDIPTQYASAFELTAQDHDGTTVGRLTGVDIDGSGLIAASYSNGDTRFLGRVAMASFNNEQGLEQVGGTKWKQSLDSGEPITGVADTGVFGSIQSSALENSNVNLTEELVNIIVAQRNYQANSRSLEVNSTLQQTILQIR